MKKLFVCWMLGTVLLSNTTVVPSGYAKPRHHASLAKVDKTGKLLGQNGWLRKHLRAGVFALGILATCTGLGCNIDHSADDIKLTLKHTGGQTVIFTADVQKPSNNPDYNYVEVADSLTDQLPDLYGTGEFLLEDREKLYAYTLGDEMHIGWLLEETNGAYLLERYRASGNRADLSNGLNLAKKILTQKLQVTKVTVNSEEVDIVLEDGDGLNFEVHFDNEGTLTFEIPTTQNLKANTLTVNGAEIHIVPEDNVVGHLLSTGYPGFDYEYRDSDGTRKTVEVVARFLSEERRYDIEGFGMGMSPRYVVLVTHYNGRELADDSKYFMVAKTKYLGHLPR